MDMIAVAQINQVSKTILLTLLMEVEQLYSLTQVAPTNNNAWKALTSTHIKTDKMEQFLSSQHQQFNIPI